MSNKPIRFAVVGPGRASGVGSGRGKTFVDSAIAMPSEIQLVAICDLDALTCESWKERGDVRVYQDFSKLLEDAEVDAICLATPAPLHGAQAIAALNAGKHVLSEVPAAYSIEDCYALVEAVERTGLTYMLAENYCFRRDVMMVSEMVRRGVFGDLIHAEGSYLHDCRDLMFDSDGVPTWRGKLQHTHHGNTYPTHSMGPICQWLGINRTDRLKTLNAFGTRALAGASYAKRNFGAEHPFASPDKWSVPNTVVVMFNTDNGVLGEHRLDWCSPRPHQMAHYGLQGTRAALISNHDSDDTPLVWIEDRSATSKTGIAGSWEELWKYADDFEHPLWRESGAEALNAGHGGGDYFIIREFTAAVREGRPPMIDVYDAVTWSSVAPLSTQSLDAGGAPVAVPNFKISNRS